jgi:hypothetical protein
MKRIPTLGLAGLAALAVSACAAPEQDPASYAFEAVPWAETDTWFKGNTHTHTTESDGDSPAEYVARWYRDHGYDFLVLSDHNTFTDPATLRGLVDSTFLLIPGEEVTSAFEGAPVHVNGLNLPGLVEARTAESLVATIQANVDAIRDVEGVPHINHPNFRWAFGAQELAQIENDRLLEIWNGHPSVHNHGGGGVLGLEAVWDVLLTGGKRIYGIAVDDAHHFQGEFAAGRANPGRGWVVVRAPSLDAAGLMEALEAGAFYASTGVEIADIVVDGGRMEVHIAERGDFKHTTHFIGAGGTLLKETTAGVAVYELDADVGYVRAKVTDSAGWAAWTQPVFVSRAVDPSPTN